MYLLKHEEDGEFSIRRFDKYVPPYAILSHTWSTNSETDEVTFKDITKRKETSKSKAGYKKLLFCYNQALSDGLEYFWVDTCCIDRRDLVGLSEAITSMFRWYQEAAKCYVYMSDVTVYPRGVEERHWKQAFRESRWFRRGWTLQELLAPSSVEFYSSDEKRLGDKVSLECDIHEVTGISPRALRGCHLSMFSIAERKSWANNRNTTRPEDQIYCQLGIFGVSIPILPGEGKENACDRLNKAIEEKESRLWRFSWFVKNIFYALPIVLGFAILLAQWTESGSPLRPTRDSSTREQLYPDPDVYEMNTPPFRPDIDASLPVFAILGKTGVGKSTFIDTLGGRHVKTGSAPGVCEGLDSCTEGIDFYKADLHFGEIYLVDTPGFDDNKGRNDSLVLSMIFDELKNLYNGDKLLKGLVYVYDISAERIGGMTAQVLVDIQKLCGVDGIRHVMLVTTRWAKALDSKEIAKQVRREQHLINHYWKAAIRHGSSVERYLGTKNSAVAILTTLNNRERLFDPASSSLDIFWEPDAIAWGSNTDPSDSERTDVNQTDGEVSPAEAKPCSRPWLRALWVLMQVILILGVQFVLHASWVVFVSESISRIYRYGPDHKMFDIQSITNVFAGAACIFWLVQRVFEHFAPDPHNPASCVPTPTYLFRLPSLVVKLTTILCPFMMTSYQKGINNIGSVWYILPMAVALGYLEVLLIWEKDDELRLFLLSWKWPF